MTQTNGHSGEAAGQLLNKAIALHRRGLTPDAERAYRDAITLDPDLLGAHYNLGVLLAPQRPADAEPHFRKVAEGAPFSAEGHFALGRVRQAIGRHEDAAVSLRRAMDIQPTADGLSMLGNSLVSLNCFMEATEPYRQAARLEPRKAEIWYNLGIALAGAKRNAEALPAFDKAIDLNPNFANAHHNRGQSLRVLGRLAEAREAFATAIRLQPSRPGFYYGLTVCARTQPGDPFVPMMEALADKPGAEAVEQISLHMALGKAYDDLGRHADSFRQVLKGAALKHPISGYDEAAGLGELRRMAEAFGPTQVSRGDGNPSPTPIFIVGMPRSGTSLIEQMLASHRDVFGAGESNALSRVVRSIETLPGGFPQAAIDADGAQLRLWGKAYLDEVTALAGGASRITDKLPYNFRYVGLIRIILPNARIIHTRRDPLDNCLSCFTNNITAEPNYNTDLGELGRYHHGYRQLMEHWRNIVPASVMLEIDYEAVVADFEAHARAILAHCGLDWDPACLEFQKTERSVNTASAAQVRQPIYTSSVGRAEAYRPFLDRLVAGLEGR